MGRRSGPTGFPAWTATIAAMRATRDEKPDDFRVQVTCTACGQYREVDLDGLIAAKGPGYSLVNKRFRCKLTRGCRGWNRFHYQGGVMRPLWDHRTLERWIEADQRERQREDEARRHVADAMRGRKWRDDPAPDGVMEDVWGIANDTERHSFKETSAVVRRWRGGG